MPGAQWHRRCEVFSARIEAGTETPLSGKGRRARKELEVFRSEDIRCFERCLGRNGIVVVKFFLHVSKQEQKRRFLERAEEPEKNWKFSDRRTFAVLNDAWGAMASSL